MRLYLAPEPSLELIRYLRSVNGEDGLDCAPVRKLVLNDAINNVRALNELDATAQLWLSHVSRPVQAYVADRARGTSTKQLVTRLFSEDVPYGAFINAGHGVCLCSPAFTFMQLATKLDTIELLRVGMELCGSYSRWQLAPAPSGDPSQPAFEETIGYTYDIPRAMNANLMEGFLERLMGYRGNNGAKLAARWLVNGSASPMETATYLLLCLPKRLGGYGLPKPILNPKLIISNPDGTKVRYPDLFWQGPNIDVEYNSDSDYSGEWARYRDSRREVELTVANVRVLPLTRPQLVDAEQFDAFAQGLRRMLGIRSRKADAGWEARHAELRQVLLAGYCD